MNKTININYLGGLRTEATHMDSGKIIITDAPSDVDGKGQSFSATDLVATSLVSSMITAMGLYAEKNGLKTGGIKGSIEKLLLGPPRRISMLNIELSFLGHRLSELQKKQLETIAINCPVAQSLNPDIAMNTKFLYNN